MVSYSFSKKILQFSFSLATGNFGSGGNTATLSTGPDPSNGPAGLRASCHITNNQGPTSGTCEGAVYGLPLSMMNQLTTLGNQLNAMGSNYVSIEAGDVNGLSLVFQGSIYEAYMDGVASMPRVPFRFWATGDGTERLKMIKPTSVQGSADVATTMQSLAGQAGWGFVNHGVNVKVNNPYLGGGIRGQISALAAMAGIQHVVDKKVLHIWPTNSSRDGGGGLVSPQTGMVGYPAFESQNVVVKMLFDPSFQVGQDFQVQSDITAANGTWQCWKIVYDLESEMPSGKWFQLMWGTPNGQQTNTSSSH